MNPFIKLGHSLKLDYSPSQTCEMKLGDISLNIPWELGTYSTYFLGHGATWTFMQILFQFVTVEMKGCIAMKDEMRKGICLH